MKRERKTKWIVWYKYNIINTHPDCDDEYREQEFQDAVEHTNLFNAIGDYMRIIWEVYHYIPVYKDVFPDIKRGLGFDIKLYRIK